MIGCLWTHVRKQPIIALYFESETVLKLYNLEARPHQKAADLEIQNFEKVMHSVSVWSNTVCD